MENIVQVTIQFCSVILHMPKEHLLKDNNFLSSFRCLKRNGIFFFVNKVKQH